MTVYIHLVTLHLSDSTWLGDFDQAISLLNRARKLVEDTPDDQFLPGILGDLGEIARFQGDFDQASTLYKKNLSLPAADSEKVLSRCGLSIVERIRGQIAEARKNLISALQFLKTEGDWVFSPIVITYVACFAVDQQLIRQATFLFGWIESHNKIKGHVQQPVYKNEFDHYLTQAREGLSDSEFNAAWVEGQSMSQEQVLALAMEVLQ
ncbi:MAG: tetratricopeptide repeat protein [Anaerolineales bacterium]|uniref:tetratricopeptide repeat protein n=1 Tax=Candidatus Villigracilis vicinus TaxID=3140679 RepID=UPI00313718EE|nr:tetratricopeptide repeat protein [Anaerolineales bacterium]